MITAKIGSGVYVKVPSETSAVDRHTATTSRPYTVYTGDDVNPPHCTCSAFRFGRREPGVLFTCKHIRLVVYGEGAS